MHFISVWFRGVFEICFFRDAFHICFLQRCILHLFFPGVYFISVFFQLYISHLFLQGCSTGRTGGAWTWVEWVWVGLIAGWAGSSWWDLFPICQLSRVGLIAECRAGCRTGLIAGWAGSSWWEQRSEPRAGQIYFQFGSSAENEIVWWSTCCEICLQFILFNTGISCHIMPLRNLRICFLYRPPQKCGFYSFAFSQRIYFDPPVRTWAATECVTWSELAPWGNRLKVTWWVSLFRFYILILSSVFWGTKMKILWWVYLLTGTKVKVMGFSQFCPKNALFLWYPASRIVPSNNTLNCKKKILMSLTSIT